MKRLGVLALLLALTLTTAATPAAAPLPRSSFGLLDAEEIAVSYEHLVTDFYKRVDPQQVMRGTHDGLVKYLQKQGVSNPVVPELANTGDPSQNIRAIDRDVAAVAAKYPSAKYATRDLTYAAIAGMLSSVKDRYTVFLSPKDFADLNAGLDGSTFSGTGIVIQSDETTKYITVSNVVPDGPADKGGVLQDDVIYTIDGKSTKGLSIKDASTLLRGKEGTTVTLQLQRDGVLLPHPIQLVRAPIKQLSVYSRMLPNKIGYVDLTVFGRDTGSELTKALDRLRAQGARALVMDLRENGGGYLDAAVEVSSKFIASGPIVSVESRQSQIETHEADNTAIPPLPLAVLVNGHTASASEITSGAIQDTGVGTIVGTKTFGKGVVQNVWRLPDNSAIKITIARYLTPHNRDINQVGIQPDVTVQENKNARQGDPARDAQLSAALTLLENKLAALNAPAPAQ